MSSFPHADKIIEAYEDQIEALMCLHRASRSLTNNLQSRFHSLTVPEIQDRLEKDREELDRWALMMLVASFEAMIRADAKTRIDWRTMDKVRKPLRDLHNQYPHRVRFEDILKIWEDDFTIKSTTKQNIRTLLNHRHWLAHGRHWTNKHGRPPDPPDAHAFIGDYVQALQGSVSDFPLG